MSETYNGWKNYATWNVALWLSNDEALYKVARRCVRYADLVDRLEAMETFRTPDNISYNDPDLDTYALDEMLMDDF
jgi:hypothetical protein